VIARITPAGALAAFPPPAGYDINAYSGLTAGPDGNLWFSGSAASAKSPGAIIRMTPAGALAAFPFPARRTWLASPGPLTVGPDGDLWFPNEGGFGEIGRLDPTPPRVTKVIAVAHPGKAIASILVDFDGALDPASARKGNFYGLAAGVER